ncbi:NUDIX hydrolase [Aquimarina agarilytica]|uniref:NUDIX hydrolase n=1 Tax=Aquimarina agarilytica TaxID=1087449 RepID=UPI0002884326|nr:NUDIX domain-containing protein [Aquimarina agarilytica]
MADELIDILTPNGTLTGEVKLKSEAHKKGLWHASVQIWIYTPDGKILIQKRAKNKDTYPNLWDISVAGHLTAGDSPIDAAIREIEEEIGYRVFKDNLIFLKTIKKSKQVSSSIIDNEFNYLYIVKLPIIISKLKLQIEEVAEVTLISISDFENQLKNHPNIFVPHGASYYNFIINTIKQKNNNQKKE